MVADKISAKTGLQRIPERVLWWIAILGGFAGVTLSGLMVRHKTRKPHFWLPVGLAWVLWTAFLLLYFVPNEVLWHELLSIGLGALYLVLQQTLHVHQGPFACHLGRPDHAQ